MENPASGGHLPSGKMHCLHDFSDCLNIARRRHLQLPMHMGCSEPQEEKISPGH